MADYTTTSEPLDPPALVTENQWQQVVAKLPVELEQMARRHRALQRCRKIQSAADLLRLLLAYALADWSFALTGAWATIIGLTEVSGVDIRQRMQGARPWLGALLAACLLTSPPREDLPPVRLRFGDATTVSRPGSQGTDWRLHLCFDLGACRFEDVEVTSGQGGESLTRFSARPGDVLVADRGYARRPGLATVLAAGGGVAVRLGLAGLPLSPAAGEPALEVVPWLRTLPPTGVTERPVWMQAVDQPGYALRLVAVCLPQEAAEAARRRLRKELRDKGKTPSADSLEAAGFCMVLTNLDPATWSAEQVLALYRLRWQVELAFKRLKGIWQLDHLRAEDPGVAQAYLLAKVLGAWLGEELTGRAQVALPEWFGDEERPLSLWRLQQLWYEAVRNAVIGQITLAMVLEALPRLQRYFRDSPRRKRPQQLAVAFHRLQELNEQAAALEFAQPEQMEMQMALS